jgi:hypothetical protein
MDREEYLRQRAAMRLNGYTDFTQSAEFADLPSDVQAAMGDEAFPETNTADQRTSDILGVDATDGVGRLEAFALMFDRGASFEASNAVADVRRGGRNRPRGGLGPIGDLADHTLDGFRGPLSNINQGIRRDFYTPTPEDVVSVADRWGLDERSYRQIAGWSASREDMDAVGEGLASLTTRDRLVEGAVGPVDGFIMDLAANAIRPEFLAAGAAVGRAMEVGVMASRAGLAFSTNAFGRAGLEALSAGIADAPLEAIRAHENPNYTSTDYAISMGFSMTLGGALGALGRGHFDPADMINLQQLDDRIAALHEGRPEALDMSGSGSVGAASRVRLQNAVTEIDEAGYLAPARIQTSFGWAPMAHLWKAEDPEVRTLGATLVWNPGAQETQGSNMFETSRRITESAGFFLRPAEDAMRQYWRAIDTPPESQSAVDKLLAPGARVTGGVTDRQADEFYEIVGQVIAGVRASDSPHVNRAVEAMRDGIEDNLYYMQDSNYTGWSVTGQRPTADTRTGRGIPEAMDVEANRNHLPRVPSRTGFLGVQNLFPYRGPEDLTPAQRADHSNGQIGNRLAEVAMRDEATVTWLTEIASRWNAGRKNTPDATGRIAPPMDAPGMAQRIMRKYVATWESAAIAELGRSRNQGNTRPMSVADRDAVREIVADMMEVGDELGPIRDDVIEAVLDLIAPAKRRTTADSPRLMSRMTLPLRADLDGDILPMFDWNAHRVFTDFRDHVAGRAALLRAGFDGPGDFKARVEATVENARTRGSDALTRAEKHKDVLLDGLGAVTGERALSMGHSAQRDSRKFWTQLVGRFNVAAYLSNTALGPMFAEYGSILFRSHQKLFTSLPAYRRFIKAARTGDRAGMEGGFLLADITAGHGSSLVRQRRTGRSRYDHQFAEVGGDGSRFQQGADEVSRKAANMTGRLSGMAQANDYMRAVSMVTDLENWAKGKLSPFQRAQAGLSEAMWARVQRVLEDPPMTTGSESGQPRIDDGALGDRAQLADPEAWNAMIGAMDRRARQIVQEPDWGHAPLWMQSPGLDLIFQFFSYPVNAVNKQVVPFFRSIAARDADAGRVVFASFSAGIGYAVRTYMSAYTKDDPQGYLDDRMTPAEIAKAMFYYSTVGSIAPNLIDGALSATGNDPLFSNTRASGLSATPYQSNPTISGVSRNLTNIQGLFKGTMFSEQDLERLVSGLLPMGNWLPAQLVINHLFDWRPDEGDQD